MTGDSFSIGTAGKLVSRPDGARTYSRPVHERSSTRRELLRQGAGTALGLAAGGTLAPLAAAATRPAGHALGFASLRNEVRLPDLPVDGRLPPWLSGVLMRNGPALFEVGSARFNHWFDGLAMLHAFAFGRGRVSYANRFLRSSAYRAWKRDGRIEYSEFATDPCRAVFSGVASVPILAPCPTPTSRSRRSPGASWPTPRSPSRCASTRAPETLGVSGTVSLGRLGTAHPHRDPATGYPLLLRGRARPARAAAGWSPSAADDGASWRGCRAEPWYMHSFALTRATCALVEQPFVVDPLDFLKPDRPPIIANYRWDPPGPRASPDPPPRRRLARRSRPSRSSSSITSMPTSAATASCSTSAPTATARSSTRCTSSACERGWREARGAPAAPGDRSRPAPVATQGSPASTSSFRGSTTRVQPASLSLCLWGRPAHARQRVPRPAGQARRAQRRGAHVARARQLSGRAGVRPPPGRAARGRRRAALSRPRRAGAASFLLALDARTLGELARAVVPHHSRSAFTGCTPRADGTGQPSARAVAQSRRRATAFPRRRSLVPVDAGRQPH